MRPTSRSRVLPRLALAAGLLVASFATAPARAETHEVAIDWFQFKPRTLKVKPGDTIVWTNKDRMEHSATADDGAFDSKAIARNQQWSWVADKPGTYPYACSFHGTMHGTIEVAP